MEKISSVLFSLFRKSPLHEQWVVACLEGAWPAIVGDRVSRACRPAHFRGALLTVAVLDPDWERPLQDMSDELLASIQLTAGDLVQRLRFVPGAQGAA